MRVFDRRRLIAERVYSSCHLERRSAIRISDDAPVLFVAVTILATVQRVAFTKDRLIRMSADALFSYWEVAKEGSTALREGGR